MSINETKIPSRRIPEQIQDKVYESDTAEKQVEKRSSRTETKSLSLFEHLVQIGTLHEKEGGKPEEVFKHAKKHIDFVCKKLDLAPLQAVLLADVLYVSDGECVTAPEGKRTFTGPYALVLAYGLKAMHEQLEYCYEVDEDDHEFGYRAFATLTLEQKVWVLHKIAFGLLDKKTPIVPLVAYLEAGVATIFRELIGCVEVEIDFAKEDGEAEDWHFNTRRAILTVHEKEGRNEPPFVEDDEEPLRLECDDIEPWKMAIEYLEDEVLWDSDYEMDDMVDMPPEHDAMFKQEMGIADSYYNAIPHDPHKPQAIKLLKDVEKLCDRVIAREEKKLEKS